MHGGHVATIETANNKEEFLKKANNIKSKLQMQLLIMLLFFVNICTVCFLWEVLSNPHDSNKTYLFGKPDEPKVPASNVSDKTTVPAITFV